MENLKLLLHKDFHKLKSGSLQVDLCLQTLKWLWFGSRGWIYSRIDSIRSFISTDDPNVSSWERLPSSHDSDVWLYEPITTTANHNQCRRSGVLTHTNTHSG